MLLHSALMTGAALDADVVVGIADAMAPVLAQVFPLDKLQSVYERTVLRLLSDESTPSVMVTARDLLSTWHLMEAERRAEEARSHEHNMAMYRAAMERRLREHPRKEHAITDLAARDGVSLAIGQALHSPTAPAPEEARGPEEREAERQARIARNKEAWHRLYAEHEQKQAERERHPRRQRTPKHKREEAPDGQAR